MSYVPQVNSEVNRQDGLIRDRSFVGITATQFLGAFNDNLFKQLMLLLAIPKAAAVFDPQQIATITFALPFVLFSGIAGHLSDRYSKRSVIVLAKMAEIGIMGLGMVGFLFYGSTGYVGLLIVLFLMGVHSAFFAPSKYGILPELFPGKELPKANGIVLMTTFLAIIFGTVSAGFVGGFLVDQERPLADSAPRLWIGSLICMGIAIVGTWTAIWIRPVPAAMPSLVLKPGFWAVSPVTVKMLLQDRPLLGAVLASSIFWMVSGIAIQAVNSFGMVQLQRGMLETSIMTACIGAGIAIGSVQAARWSHGTADAKVVRWGVIGIFTALLCLSISLPVASLDGWQHLLGYRGSLFVLLMLGFAAGLFAIPLQVFLQSRPSKDQKGRMLGAMNLANYVAILMSGLLYGLLDAIVTTLSWPRSSIFGFMSLLILPLLLWYRPNFDSITQTRLEVSPLKTVGDSVI
ncbi:MAG: MFS transporter [Pirellula sp.]|jgi:acyl-[acyl-carrier-protein]-phospholipid O-acyltransferase/long-chain-fatty-acid--[acyl-carrier-protein] ligase